MKKGGLDGVVAAQTRLSHVDGQAGQLIIGGYELKELAGRVSFEEAAHLLWRGALPSREELTGLEREIAGLRALPDEAMRVVRAAAKSPPIDALRMACATLSLDLPRPDDISPATDIQAAKLLTARFPTTVAAHARLSAGKEPIAPRSDLPLAANFLYMVQGTEPDPIAARAIDTYWVTVIDHGMNASTFTARVIASTRSDMVSAVTGAIGALKGPLHGGAPGPVLDMLKDIKSADRAEGWVRNELAAGRRIMGFGHRVYKTEDPRATHLRKLSERIGEMVGDTRWYEMSRKMEEVVMEEKGLYPNVDFYAASVYYSMGIPVDLFTPIFAASRVAGWTAHIREQYADNRLIRPESAYVGPPHRSYVPIDQRG